LEASLLSLYDIPEHLEKLHEHSQTLARRLRDALGDAAQDHRVNANTNILTEFPSQIIAITDGILKYCEAGKLVRLYEKDDIFVVDGDRPDSATLSAEFGTLLVAWLPTTFRERLAADATLLALWFEYREIEVRILQGLCAAYTTEDVQPPLNLGRFVAGDCIIREGDPSDEIFVMLEGEAEVSVNSVQVGTIEENEIFGEMGVFTDEPRTATVTATSDCLVHRLASDEFHRLVAARPDMVLELTKTLVNRIAVVNDKLAFP